LSYRRRAVSLPKPVGRADHASAPLHVPVPTIVRMLGNGLVTPSIGHPSGTRLRLWELHALVLVEAALVTVCGLVAGLLVGSGIALSLVHVLRGLFILEPTYTFPAGRIAMLTALCLRRPSSPAWQPPRSLACQADRDPSRGAIWRRRRDSNARGTMKPPTA
jgi:hypothetical protein